MKIITPDCDYIQDIEKYKKNLKHLKPGSRVLIFRSDPAGISEALIGNWELNLISIPVEPYLTPQATIEFIKKECSPHVIVHCTDTKNIFEFLDGGELSPVEDYAIFYTSGTTSNPKGVVQTREAMKYNAIAVAELHEFNKNSVHLTALPLYHCNAAAMSLFGNYFMNGTAVFLKKFKPETYFEYCEKYQAGTANLVPTMIADLLEAKLKWPTQLRYVLTAATALSQEICKKFYNLYGSKLRQGYGLSEAINFSFTMPLLNDIEFKKHMVDNYPAVGLPIPGTEFKIENGEVFVRGPNNMRCYWNNKIATEETIINGWIKTGDKGELRDGFLVLTGRFKEIIIKGGDNYSPVMIEDEFRRSGITGDIVVVGCKDNRLGEDIALVANKYQKINIDNKKLQPASVRYGNIQRTQTKKPQRKLMSKGMVSMSLPTEEYNNTLKSAGRIAEKIILKTPTTPQQKYLYNISKKLIKNAGEENCYNSVKPFFNAIESKLDVFWNGDLKEHIFKGMTKEWESLMNDTPMGGFPKLAHQFCLENNLYQGKILEVGAGVGNFSKYIPAGVDYIRSDLKSSFLKGDYKNEIILNIDDPYTIDNAFNMIVGINVFHCAKNKQKAIQNAYNNLLPGGYLLLGEGQAPGDVWALDILFGFIDGWWNRGGFIDRYKWLDMFNVLSPSEIGYSVYREGKYDLGGILWLKK